MKLKLFTLFVVTPLALGLTNGSECSGTDYAQLKRLQAVLDLASFPEPSIDGIQTWKQLTPSRGAVNKFDFTKFPMQGYKKMQLKSVVKFYGGKAAEHDLTNVVIISQNGRSVRFVDYTKPGADIIVRKGDVIAFLLPEETK